MQGSSGLGYVYVDASTAIPLGSRNGSNNKPYISILEALTASPGKSIMLTGNAITYAMPASLSRPLRIVGRPKAGVTPKIAPVTLGANSSLSLEGVSVASIGGTGSIQLANCDSGDASGIALNISAAHLVSVYNTVLGSIVLDHVKLVGFYKVTQVDALSYINQSTFVNLFFCTFHNVAFDHSTALKPVFVNTAALRTQYHTLTAADILNQQILLDDIGDGDDAVVNVVAGGNLMGGIDYIVTGSYLKWAGMPAQNVLKAGDVIRAFYGFAEPLSGFHVGFCNITKLLGTSFLDVPLELDGVTMSAGVSYFCNNYWGRTSVRNTGLAMGLLNLDSISADPLYGSRDSMGRYGTYGVASPNVDYATALRLKRIRNQNSSTSFRIDKGLGAYDIGDTETAYPIPTSGPSTVSLSGNDQASPTYRTTEYAISTASSAVVVNTPGYTRHEELGLSYTPDVPLSFDGYTTALTTRASSGTAPTFVGPRDIPRVAAPDGTSASPYVYDKDFVGTRSGAPGSLNNPYPIPSGPQMPTASAISIYGGTILAPDLSWAVGIEVNYVPFIRSEVLSGLQTMDNTNVYQWSTKVSGDLQWSPYKSGFIYTALGACSISVYSRYRMFSASDKGVKVSMMVGIGSGTTATIALVNTSSGHRSEVALSRDVTVTYASPGIFNDSDVHHGASTTSSTVEIVLEFFKDGDSWVAKASCPTVSLSVVRNTFDPTTTPFVLQVESASELGSYFTAYNISASASSFQSDASTTEILNLTALDIQRGYRDLNCTPIVVNPLARCSGLANLDLGEEINITGNRVSWAGLPNPLGGSVINPGLIVSVSYAAPALSTIPHYEAVPSKMLVGIK